MVKRTARRGKNAGNSFWGCSKYPKCRETLPIRSNSTRGWQRNKSQGALQDDWQSRNGPEVEIDTISKLRQQRVDWLDGTFSREGWVVRHASAGGILRELFGGSHRVEASRLACCWIACQVQSAAQRSSPASPIGLAIGSMTRILARGLTPPMHPEAEALLLQEYAAEFEKPPESWHFSVPNRGESQLDYSLCESDFERRLAMLLGETAPSQSKWLVPQASLKALSIATRLPGAESSGEQRCDFLFCPPGAKPIVFEVDGSQHRSAQNVDETRDKLLRHSGLHTVRISTSELKVGLGPGIDNVIGAIRGAHSSELKNSENLWHPLVWAPIQTHRLVLAICESIDAGFLKGEHWVIDLEDPTGLSAHLVGPYLETFAALAEIWGASDHVPQVVEFQTKDMTIQYRQTRSSEFGYSRDEHSKTSSQAAAVAVCLQSDWSPSELLPLQDPNGTPSVIVRSTGVPVLPRDPVRPRKINRPSISEVSDSLRSSLRTLLTAIFNMKDFREGQFEAISLALSGRDCAVLLPTGAGKSMIYQLTGLLLGGRVIAVDPITSLINDQIGGLAEHGIDRTFGITASNSRDGYGTWQDAYFLFVSPERFQRQRFRDDIATSARSFPVSLVVVDEAHCVSEWGHDFRDAYLNFGRTIRTVCDPSKHGPPPILALTGTASRAVLSDVLFQLGISTDSEDCVIRPVSFDRSELEYEIRLTKPLISERILIDVLRCLPADLNQQPSAFQIAGQLPGIVFISTVNGRYRNLKDTLEAVQTVIPSAVGFSTTAPKGWDYRDWATEKEHNARNFRRDKAAAIVATKAYGMGIDKPNIRWVVHFGLPQSIEAFYQEVGRAGRDRKEAKSVLILTENDQEQSRSRLHSIDQQGSVERGKNQPRRDDISTVEWFHKRAFPSANEDAETTTRIYRQLCESSTISLGQKEEERLAAKRALHRLAVLGAVEDYCIEGMGRSEKAVVEVSVTNAERIATNLYEFVARSQPGRAEKFRSIGSRYSDTEGAVRKCSLLLAEFVYDTIGRARQRSLFEMWELAQTGSKNPERVRQGILDYLTEGMPSDAAQGLAELEIFSYIDWIVEMSKIVTKEELTQWRAAAARLLGSYPDHPGLLLARAFSDSLLPHNQDTSGKLNKKKAHDLEIELQQSIESAFSRYEADEKDTENMLLWLLDEFTAAIHFTHIPKAQKHLFAATVVEVAFDTLPSSTSIEEWLDANWNLSPYLAVFKFIKEIKSATEMAHRITTAN